MPAAWVAAAGAVMGAMNSGSGSSQSTQNQLDPRIVPYLYGDSGLLGNVNSLYQRQNAQGGLNPMQNAGLEMQRQTLMSPQYTAGFDQMRQAGAGLMGQSAAGNPFSPASSASPVQTQTYSNPGTPMQGGGYSDGIRGRIPNMGPGLLNPALSPIQQVSSPYSTAMPAMPAVPQAAALPGPIDDLYKRYNGGSIG